MSYESQTGPVGAPGGVPGPTGDPAQQRSPGGADVSPNTLGGEEAVSRSEFGKVVAQRQAAKERARELAAEVERLREQLQETSDEEMHAFRRWKEAQHRAGIPADQQGLDLQEIASSVRGPLKARMEALRGKKDALERKLADLLRDQELRVAAARANAIHPEQVVALLRQHVRMKEAADGRFEPELSLPDDWPAFDDAPEAPDVQQLVGWFLSQPDNANLVRATVTPGSGAKQAGGTADTMEYVPRSKAEFLALPPDERRAVAARMTRNQRDALLGRRPADSGGYI